MLMDFVNFIMQKVQKILTLGFCSEVEGGFWWLSESFDSRKKCSGIELMIINYMCVIFRLSRGQNTFIGDNMVRVHLLMDIKSSFIREKFKATAFLFQ